MRRIRSFPIVGQHGCLVGGADGYAVLGFGRGLPELLNRLLLVRLSDGGETAIDADGSLATLETFGFAGWLARP